MKQFVESLNLNTQNVIKHQTRNAVDTNERRHPAKVFPTPIPQSPYWRFSFADFNQFIYLHFPVQPGPGSANFDGIPKASTGRDCRRDQCQMVIGKLHEKLNSISLFQWRKIIASSRDPRTTQGWMVRRGTILVVHRLYICRDSLGESGGGDSCAMKARGGICVAVKRFSLGRITELISYLFGRRKFTRCGCVAFGSN